MQKIKNLRVISIAWKTKSTRLIELRSPDGEELPDFQAGAHVDLHLPTGITRSYSLMNRQGERYRYLLGVRRDAASRGGSSYLHDVLRVGDILGVGEPRNLFKLDEAAPASLLIGGGIGVTPIVCMAARLNELGSEWKLHYAVSSRSEAAFLAELEPYGSRVQVHYDEEHGGVLDLEAVIRAASPGAHLYCCGPEPMMQSFGALTRDIDPKRVHVEHFKPVDAAAVEGGFLVELRRSGRTLAVPQGSTILEALANAGIVVASSCQRGVCGTCETRVLSGIPDHRDSILTSSERAANDTMMICCSGSRSERLVLDL